MQLGKPCVSLRNIFLVSSLKQIKNSKGTRSLRRNTFIYCLLAFTLSVTFSGCVNFTTRTVNFLAYLKGQEVTTDVAFGPEPLQKLNIYSGTKNSPNAKDSPALPVVIFFHGGGWSTGSKDEYRFVAEPFTTAGYIAVIPDYRKYPEYRYPTFMNDAAQAVAWVYQHIAEYGGDPRKIFLLGHSAGAHMVTLLTTNYSYLQEKNVPRTAILATAGLSGPYDFVPKEQKYKEIFAAAGGDASSAMPATYIDGLQQPMLLIYGSDDDTVKLENIEHMQQKVKQHGGQLECRRYEGLGHIGTISVFTLPLRNKAPVVKDILAYFQKTLDSQPK